MSVIETVLKKIDGGRILDIATQDGHFVYILMKNLKSYADILGIDINKDAIESARKTYGQSNVRFLEMDAEQLGFEDSCFDTVTISASLHHLSNIQIVLNEMVRILKPGGHFILVEMHQDGQTRAMLTSVYLHHWVAEVDSALGYLHNKTLPRQEFVDYVTGLGLSEFFIYDDNDIDSDPREPSRITQLGALIDKMIQRAERAYNFSELEEQGEQLRKRLHSIGVQREPIILIHGVK